MKTTFLAFSLAIGLTDFGALRARANGGESVQPVVRSIRVQTFDRKTGTLDPEDLITTTSGGRWNDIRSSALFIVLEVSGPGFQEYPRRGVRAYGVRLTVTDSKRAKTIYNETRSIVRLNENGLLFIPYLVAFDSCSSVDFTAKIIGRDAGPPTTASAFFNCGE